MSNRGGEQGREKDTIADVAGVAVADQHVADRRRRRPDPPAVEKFAVVRLESEVAVVRPAWAGVCMIARAGMYSRELSSARSTGGILPSPVARLPVAYGGRPLFNWTQRASGQLVRGCRKWTAGCRKC